MATHCSPVTTAGLNRPPPNGPTPPFPTEQEMGTKILQAALALHERVSSTFRKTAVNFHYEFTVRS